jgi:hypothetical protein
VLDSATADVRPAALNETCLQHCSDTNNAAFHKYVYLLMNNVEKVLSSKINSK